jgi:hypothetical protein
MTAMFGKESFRTPVPRLQKTGSAKGEAIEIISSAMGMTSGEATERVGGQGFTLDPFRVVRTPKTFEPTFALTTISRYVNFTYYAQLLGTPKTCTLDFLQRRWSFEGQVLSLNLTLDVKLVSSAILKPCPHELWFPLHSVRI